MTEVAAIIVVRGGSTRLKRKNALPIGGKSLLARKIAQLKSCSNVHRVIVGSDDGELLSIANEAGAETVRRPDFFCDERQATANDMISNMCELVDTNVVLWAHCTNPLVTAATYDRAVADFFKMQKQGYDSLLSVAELREHLWDENRRPANYDPYGTAHVPASRLPPLYKQDGAIFIQPHAQMLANRYFFGKNPHLFIMPEAEVFDVNTPFEFDMVKAHIEAQEKMQEKKDGAPISQTA